MALCPPPPSLSFSPPQWIIAAGLEVGQGRVNTSSADCCLRRGGVNENNFAWTHSDARTHARTQSALLAHPTHSVLTSAGSGRPADRKVETETQKTRQPSLRQSNEDKKKKKVSLPPLLFSVTLSFPWLNFTWGFSGEPLRRSGSPTCWARCESGNLRRT